MSEHADPLADPTPDPLGGQQPGTLSGSDVLPGGYNPSEDEAEENATTVEGSAPEPETPAEEPQPAPPAEEIPAAPDPEEEHPATGEAEEPLRVEEGADPAEVAAALEETAPEPEADPTEPQQPEPPAAASRKRTYVILEEVKVQGQKDPMYSMGGEVEARNGDNALRAAYRKLCQERDQVEEAPEITMGVVASRMFRPRPVKGRARNAPPTIEIG